MHRLLMSAFALFALATTLVAQRPFAGTWKLNTAKTIYTLGGPSKEMTVVVEEQGDSLQVTVTGAYSDGSPLSLKYTVPVKGGAGKVQEGPFDAMLSKVTSADIREHIYSKGGKEQCRVAMW